MKIDRSGLFPVITFDSKEEQEAYERSLAELDWHTIQAEPSISIEEVKKRRFGQEPKE